MSAVANSTAYIEICAGPLSAPAKPLNGPMLIGRSSSAELLLDHPSVSRRHAQIDRDSQGRWSVRDLDSRNGTTVNGASIKEHVLVNGDEIGVGQILLRFVTDPSTGSLEEPDAPGYTISSLASSQPPRLAPEHVAAILGFGRSLQEIREPAERLQRLLELAVSQELRGWWAYALQISDSQGELQIRTLHPPASSRFASPGDPHLSRSVLRAALDGGEPVVASNLSRLPRFGAQMTMMPDAMKMSAVACPLRRDAGGIDLLYVILPPSVGGVEWLMLISLAAEQYLHSESSWAMRTAAIQRAAVQREMDLARAVQAGTLPRAAGPEALDWAVRFEPCLAVAGDYVDVVRRDDGKVLLVVADAAGKGMQAALITAGLHAILNTEGRGNASLAQVVASAERYLKLVLPECSFVTLAALLLDVASGQASSVNCGHPPILVIDSAGEPRALEGGENLPLGLNEVPIRDAPTQIAAGNWIMGYTDGLTEMRDESGQMLGMQRLREQLIAECAGDSPLTANQLADRVQNWLVGFRGSQPAEDDRTLLIARRLPSICP